MKLIRALIPLGLAEVGRIPEEEVERLAGPRHGRKEEGQGRWRADYNNFRPHGSLARYTPAAFAASALDLKAPRSSISRIPNGPTWGCRPHELGPTVKLDQLRGSPHASLMRDRVLPHRC